MKEFFKKYKHGLFFLYMFIYFPWFHYVEKTVTTDFHEIHMPLDDMIPFMEIFIIPYLLWFVYVAAFAVIFFFKDAGEFTRLCIFLGVGMTVFLIVSTVYPNGHYLRPEVVSDENIFAPLINTLYSTDTSTNIMPSIHTYNSLGIGLAVIYSKHLKNMWIQIPSFILMVLIIMSTVFLKQHSMWDLIGAFILAFPMWLLLYSPIKIQFKEKMLSHPRSI
ncbi:MAG: phosphatase PAP2 family protein [Eubacterium sp.]|nr:phosphatase PAP2 family protein [Eubacterium sp.]